MRNKLFISIFIVFCILTSDGFSQNFHTSSNKALKIYNEGVTAFDFLDFAKAESDFNEAVSIDRKFYEAYIMLGELMTKQNRYSEASANYKKAVKIDSLFFRPVFFNLASAELLSGDYSNALIHFRVYLAQTGMSQNNRISAARGIKNCEFAVTAIKNPVPFSPVSVGEGINTSDDEYWPSITADGLTMMFTRQPNVSNNPGFTGLVQEDFYISYYENGEWQKAFNAGTPLNTNQNEGAQTLSSDGSYMYFTACNRPEGLGNCDIYFSAYKAGKWTEPYNLGPPVNSGRWESQPSISADGKTLFFSSSRSGGLGGKDIWFSRLNEKNVWTKPKNLGDVINSAEDEMSPFIHFDGKTLYFASNGRVGMGGFDIYVTRLRNDSTWTEPKNLGYPINTCNDDMGLVIESAGQKAYFSSIREKSKGKDIFSFNLYESVQTRPGFVHER